MTNSEQVAEEIIALGLQPGAQNLPNPIPVVETNPKLLRRVDVVRSFNEADGTTGLTIYTTPSNKRFYLTGVHLSHTQNAGATNTAAIVRCTPLLDTGTTRDILTLAMQTTTAQSYSISREFTVPIELAKGTAILLVTGDTNAAQTSRGSIQGYTVEIMQ